MTIETDVVIIAAGPCARFQLFELGLPGIHTHLVDTLPGLDGQYAELYPGTPVRDISAHHTTGAQKPIEQIASFKPEFLLAQQPDVVVQIHRQDESEAA